MSFAGIDQDVNWIRYFEFRIRAGTNLTHVMASPPSDALSVPPDAGQVVSASSQNGIIGYIKELGEGK